jgi:hypothetical protein
MNTFTTNMSATQLVAEFEIQERVQAAERRALARTARARRRAERREARAAVRRSRKLTGRPPTRLPWLAFRFPHPAR